MQSMAPRPCFFIIVRARSMRYLRSRSQLTRCCQSSPPMPKFAVPMQSLPAEVARLGRDACCWRESEAGGRLEEANEEARARAGLVAGDLRIGLMPTFTRAVLAPTLEDFVPRHPDVRLHVLEGYSAFLTDMVLANELDFAIVPAFEGRVGLKSRLLVRDREMLLSGGKHGRKPLAPVRLADCAPLKIVVPGPDNVRRRNLETYFQTHGVEIAAMLEMDAMIGTLEFVARSDWMTVLPSLISVNDIGKGDLVVNPIDPPLHAEFVVIQPTRRTLSMPARLFLERFEAEVASIHAIWDAALASKASGQR